jgi:hypothetical protein
MCCKWSFRSFCAYEFRYQEPELWGSLLLGAVVPIGFWLASRGRIKIYKWVDTVAVSKSTTGAAEKVSGTNSALTKEQIEMMRRRNDKFRKRQG